MDMNSYVVVAGASVTGLGMVTVAGLAGWRGWLQLKRQELDQGHPAPSGRLHVRVLHPRRIRTVVVHRDDDLPRGAAHGHTHRTTPVQDGVGHHLTHQQLQDLASVLVQRRPALITSPVPDLTHRGQHRR